MKRYRGISLALSALLATLPLLGCGNALEGGSTPSGSIIHWVSAAPNTDTKDAFTPDLYLTECSSTTDSSGNVTITYEKPGLHNNFVDVTLRNDSRPNTPTGQSTNSFVTMNRYRIDFTGINKSVSIPSIDGAGLGVGIAPDQTGIVSVIVMDLPTIFYIQSHYPSIGRGESLTLRATITIWGEDSFKVPVSVTQDVTLVADDYSHC
jgi:hypothetical protein